MSNDRVIAVAAALFAVCTIAGIALQLNGAPVGDSDTVDAANWLASSGHRTMAIIGIYAMAAGGIAFLVFAAALTQRLRVAGAGNATLDIMRLSAGVFAALQLAGGAGMGIAAISIGNGNEPKPISPDVTRVAALGFEIWVAGAMIAAALFVATVSVSALKTGALPRWLGWVGILCTVLLIGAFQFLPAFALPIWAICVAVVVVVRSASTLSFRTSAATA
jgi:hypothetical protein